MRQRVALARTLVLGKGLVLLDEPFGSLDALTRAEMHCWLLDAMDAHPSTWVLVTHDVREAVLLGDHVAVLEGHPARLEGWIRRAARPRGAPGAGGAGGGRRPVDPGEGAGPAPSAAATMDDLAAEVRRALRRRRW